MVALLVSSPWGFCISNNSRYIFHNVYKQTQTLWLLRLDFVANSNSCNFFVSHSLTQLGHFQTWGISSDVVYSIKHVRKHHILNISEIFLFSIWGFPTSYLRYWSERNLTNLEFFIVILHSTSFLIQNNDVEKFDYLLLSEFHVIL